MKGKELPAFGKYTKAELIWILERAYVIYGGSYFIQSAIDGLENKKQLERLNRCDAISKEAEACRARYCDIIKPYTGKPLSEIPRDILELAAQEIEKAQELDKEWTRLIDHC